MFDDYRRTASTFLFLKDKTERQQRVALSNMKKVFFFKFCLADLLYYISSFHSFFTGEKKTNTRQLVAVHSQAQTL